MPCKSSFRVCLPLFLLLFAFVFCASPLLMARNSGPKWNHLSSSHFLILTDATRDEGVAASLHFEQMYALFGQLLSKNKIHLSQPLEIILFRSQSEYEDAAPMLSGKPISAPGFAIPGDDRFYVVLNAERGDNWRAISYQFARWLLNYNYPPTPAWFDEGFAAYFSSANFEEKQGFIGGAPEFSQNIAGSSAKSLTDALQNSAWIPLIDLFSAPAKQNATLFRAESWMLMNYLFTKGKMTEMGTYFGLAEGQQIPVAQAIQNSFGISAAQLEQAVKAYFHAGMQSTPAIAGAPAADRFARPIPLPETPLDVGTSAQPVPSSEAQALVAEMEMRLPERRAKAKADLASLQKQYPETEVIGDRALAWLALHEGNFSEAKDDLGQAFQSDQNDAWSHYYFAQMQYRIAQSHGGQPDELANMMVGLRMVIDQFPEFAEAYNLLSVARLQGGGLNSALDAIRAAMFLAPRCESCRLHLAQIYLAQKKWDPARALLQQLKVNPDPHIAQVAGKELQNLPYLMKYGIALDEEGQAGADDQGSASSESDSGGQNEQDSTSQAPATQRAPKLTPDTRPVKYASAELISVTCANPPRAVLKLRIHGRMETANVNDFNNLAVVGADKFSCDWENQKVSLNYRGTIHQMDVISIELQ